MIDLHVHLWPHRPGTPVPTYEQLERCCEAAAARGIERIAVTEHSHRFTRVADEVLPHWTRPAAGHLADATDRLLETEGGADLDGYVASLLGARDRGLPLLVGLEVDYLPGAMPAMAEVLAEYPFDVLLGSVHWLDDWLFDAYGTEVFAREWRTRDTSSVYERYVDAVAELAGTGVVDVLAHVDVIKVAGHRPPDLAIHEDRLIEVVAGTGVAVEVSSAGLRKEAGEVYPSPRLLAGLAAAGVPFTTASDAHEVGQIGDGFDELSRILDEVGVRELVEFHRRHRVSVDR